MHIQALYHWQVTDKESEWQPDKDMIENQQARWWAELENWVSFHHNDQGGRSEWSKKMPFGVWIWLLGLCDIDLLPERDYVPTVEVITLMLTRILLGLASSFKKHFLSCAENWEIWKLFFSECSRLNDDKFVEVWLLLEKILGEIGKQPVSFMFMDLQCLSTMLELPAPLYPTTCSRKQFLLFFDL